MVLLHKVHHVLISFIPSLVLRHINISSSSIPAAGTVSLSRGTLLRSPHKATKLPDYFQVLHSQLLSIIFYLLTIISYLLTINSYLLTLIYYLLSIISYLLSINYNLFSFVVLIIDVNSFSSSSLSSFSDLYSSSEK